MKLFQLLCKHPKGSRVNFVDGDTISERCGRCNQTIAQRSTKHLR